MGSITRFSAAGAAVASIAGAALLYFGAFAGPQDLTCPVGYSLVDPVEHAREFRPGLSDADAERIRAQFGERACLSSKHPEPPGEMMRMNDELMQSWGIAPPGALRQAIEHKQAMQAAGLADQVPNANAVWEEYGQGSLNTDALNLGNGFVNGRVDSLDYDPVGKRLFASVGTGGVWMSTDLGGQWQNIGDALPTLIIGAVAWTSAGGGTLIAGSGEPLNGGFTFVGMGAFWTSDLGATWNEATGVPDGAMTYQAEVDPSRPEIVYLATSKGLYRSTDAGRTYVNVVLPTGCSDLANAACQLANFVTDVVVKEPGGLASKAVVCGPNGCPVLAAVGYRAGKRTYLDGTPHSPGNGLYRSDTGAPNTFTKLNVFGDGISPIGFAKEDRVGRTELGNAIGPLQDHNYVYAIVQDATRLNGGIGVVDVDGLPPPPCPPAPAPCTNTYFNGIYVSADFGSSWIRMADEAELANPSTGSSLATYTAAAAGYAPGIQSWYNLYIKPDPTRADANGVPTRLVFGLEEVWANRTVGVPLNGLNQQGSDDFKVIGTYFAGESCQFLNAGTPYCPTSDPLTQTTPHPDQHEAIFIPDAAGGVDLIVGNDGGVYRQHADALLEFTNANWGTGANDGFYTLLPYGIGVAENCTVWFGLQDNGSGLIDPKTREMFMNFGGDGGFSAVDPANADIAYTETPGGALRRTLDGGLNWTTIQPTQPTRELFINPFVMDPTDANHMMTGGPQIVEHLNVVAATTGNWTQVFDLGTAPAPGNEPRNMSAIDLHGDAAYVGFCGLCNVFTTRANTDQAFHNGIATNVGGAAPPKRGTGDGWHFAAARGLDNRYITALEIDPADPSTVYATLSGYSNAQWLPPGQYLDPNTNIGTGHVFKSVNAGEDFVDISGNLPDVPVFWVMLRENQLIVGTQIGTFISSDTDGSLWAPFGTGMPNVPTLQVTTFPGDLSQVFASTFGRGIWRLRFPGHDDVCVTCPTFTGVASVIAPAAGGCTLDVSWPAAEDSCAAGGIAYDLYRSTDPLFEPGPENLLAGNLTALEYTDTTVQGGSEYFYLVRARDGAGHVEKNLIRKSNLAAGTYGTDPDGVVDDAGDTVKTFATGGAGQWYTRDTGGAGDSKVYATSPSGNYGDGVCITLESGILLLGSGATLTFDSAWGTEATWDGGIVEIATEASGFTNWTKLTDILYPAVMAGEPVLFDTACPNPGLDDGQPAFTGSSNGEFQSFSSNLSAWANQAVKIRFVFGSDGATNDLGWFIDNVAVNNLRTAEACVVNALPVVDAGTGFTMDEGTQRSLAGTASDADSGDTLALTWTQESGPAVADFTGTDTLTPSFTAPQVDADTLLTFKLSVTDGKATVSDTVTVAVHDLIVPPPDPVVGGGATEVGDNKVGGALPPLTLLALGLMALRRRRFR